MCDMILFIVFRCLAQVFRQSYFCRNNTRHSVLIGKNHILTECRLFSQQFLVG